MKIFGEVLDGNTMEPLAGVTLRVSQMEGAKPVPNVITNRAGKFSLEDANLLAESKIEFILNGYQDKSLMANELQGGNVFIYSVVGEEDAMIHEGEVETPETKPLAVAPKKDNTAYYIVGAVALGLLYLMFRKKK